MKKLFTIFILFIICIGSPFAQTIIQGTVTNNKNNPIPGVNIFIKNSYDGTITDNNGVFNLKTTLSKNDTLIFSIISYKTTKIALNHTQKNINLKITLEDELHELDMVTISAGMFEAGDEKKSVVLSSLDIATTAGSDADIVSAMKTLPGTSVSGGLTGLYVRGGEGREAATYIDGLRVPNPFYNSVPDISQRGRFNPFIFQGTYFSTGGYSAEYGDALSSALVLNTIALPSESHTEISLMSLGAGIGHNERFDKSSLGIFLNYTNLNPYNNITEQNIDWNKSVISYQASLIYRLKTSETGLLKIYSQYEEGGMSFFIPDYNYNQDKIKMNFNEKDLYTTITFKEQINDKWILSTGTSFSYNQNNANQYYIKIIETDNDINSRLKLQRSFNEYSKIKFGIGHEYSDFKGSYQPIGYEKYKTPIEQNYYHAFIEGDWYLTSKIVLRTGFRTEYANILDKYNLAPRTSLAYKTGENSQISIAYGKFYQQPDLKYYNPNRAFPGYEKASHYIANYQYMGEERVFRAEAYYKSYDKLITVESINYEYDFLSKLDGAGYAQGMDIFYRDKKTFNNADFWISYSYLDTKRKYNGYSKSVTPDFASTHTLSTVYKHFIEPLNSNIGFTYVYASGRPYNDPNSDVFMSEKTKDYHNLSLNYTYLFKRKNTFTVIVLSVSNVLGVDNIHGYNYYGDKKTAIKDPSNRMIFLGIFLSIGRDNSNDF